MTTRSNYRTVLLLLGISIAFFIVAITWEEILQLTSSASFVLNFFRG